MSLQLLKAGTSDVLTLNGISKRAFDSDILVGAASPSGPPGYMSMAFHMKMARQGHLYKLTENHRQRTKHLDAGTQMRLIRFWLRRSHLTYGWNIYYSFVLMRI